MQIIVEILDKNNRIIKKEFNKEQLNIGSSSTNDLIFENDEMVSPNHATILLKDNSFYIYAHSMHETIVNDEAVEIALLEPDSVVKLGDDGPSFIFKYSSKSPEEIKRRWYDKNPLLKKAIDLLSVSDKENSRTISAFINNVFNFHSINKESTEALIQMVENINVDKRWYDMDKDVQKLIESLKVLDQETQNKIAIDLIKFIDCIECKHTSC